MEYQSISMDIRKQKHEGISCCQTGLYTSVSNVNKNKMKIQI